MSQKIEEIRYCPAGHSSKDLCSGRRNCIRFDLGICCKVALKEIKDSRYDIAEFLKMIKTIYDFDGYDFITKYYGISKNPSTQNYIIVMESFDVDLHNLLTKTFWDLGWKQKNDILFSIAAGLRILHAGNLVHCNLHSGNILNDGIDSVIDLDLCELENDLILKCDKIYGSIPYIPPEVLRGNRFTREGDIYSFGGIMYEIVTAQRPFADQAHDTYLMIDICNEWYLNLMYRCWSDDPSERPITDELVDLFQDVLVKLQINIVDNDVMRQLKIARENQKNTSKSQKHELLELFAHSSKLHPQSCYIGRYIHTLHGLNDLLEEIKSGKSSDPNVLKSNESTILNVNTYDIH
ncbi:7852_t:CDS:2 [Diversispora eburnea]|uniref:7852_t:CDS:1 n=1 Tax=Diversispora eburnea TaxID=1213867 RepID=A0A9N9F733_9GLOM|nr:7852_t:CDS:2 [Diversispora eburnea]